MSVKLLTEHYLEFLSLKGGCTCSSESTHVKISHCWKSHVAAQLWRNQIWVCEAYNKRVYCIIYVLKLLMHDPIDSFNSICLKWCWHLWPVQWYDTCLSCQLTLSGNIERFVSTVKLILSSHPKRPKISFQDQLSLNAGQTYCKMLLSFHLSLRPTFCLFLSGRLRQVLL